MYEATCEFMKPLGQTSNYRKATPSGYHISRLLQVIKGTQEANRSVGMAEYAQQ